jgi:transposase
LRSIDRRKIVGETAQVGRFYSKDAFARHNGTAPLPVWSSNKQRHRLSRTGNRQLLARRKNSGDGGMEALRVLKRRLSDVGYRAMIADQADPTIPAA